MSLLYTICRYTTSKYEFFKELDIFFATYQTQKKFFLTSDSAEIHYYLCCTKA